MNATEHRTPDPHRYGWQRVDFDTTFAAGLHQGGGDDGALHLSTGSGPRVVPAGKPGTGLTGTTPLAATCDASPGEPRRRIIVTDLDLPIEDGTELRYVALPELDEDLDYRATWFALDGQLDDGSWLSDTDLHDQYGIGAGAAAQGEGKILLVDHWNQVRLDLSPCAGRRLVSLAVVFAPPTAGTARAWLDRITVGRPQDRTARGSIVEYVDTRRGSHSSGEYSRGNNVPAAAMPNGFTLLVPLTDAGSQSWLYSWAAHNNAENRPALQGVGISHIPSPWMGDRNQLAFQVSSTPGVPDASLDARALAFSHDDEQAMPHRYAVDLDGGHRVQLNPTDHGGVFTFTFPGERGHVLIDAVATDGAGPDGPVHLDLDPEAGTFTGWSDHGSSLSVGRSRMYVVGRFDRPASAAGRADGDRPHARYLTFDGADPVELRVATSYISTEQAWHTFDLELAEAGAREVGDRALAAWQQRLEVLEVQEATPEQLASVYGSLYRLNLYPSHYAENAGTDAEPQWRHASPVIEQRGASSDTETGAVVRDGRMYVNHGFWDTYRTCWSAYALLYPQIAAELADGFVQQYREGGWVARWSSPGYADLMTGTSSDVAFADLAAKGVTLKDPLGTYEAALRNATTIPPHAGVGRKRAASSFFRGYVPRDEPESVSWSCENYINDAALARQARSLVLTPGLTGKQIERLFTEERYFGNRARGYQHLFDVETGFLRGKDASGAFEPAARFDPDVWGGDYTETNAWNFGFHVPHDGNGLVDLHGGVEQFRAFLERFFAATERADKHGTYGRAIHEMVEARDIRIGQLGFNNQPAHAIAYQPIFAGRWALTQEVVREILTRCWTGNDLGQGYPGDEDNGEMSAWYLLSALGIYPLWAGSPQWMIGAPLFTRAVVHRPDGDLVFDAPGNGPRTPYVHHAFPSAGPELDHEQLISHGGVRYQMAAEPPAYFDDVTPTSLTETTDEDDRVYTWRDVTSDGTWYGEPALIDDEAAGCVPVGGTVLMWRGRAHEVIELYTLTSDTQGAPAPSSWKVEVREGNSREWKVVDSREDEAFQWAGQVRPFSLGDARAVPGQIFRISFDDGSLAQVELLATTEPSDGPEGLD